ncbi:MAG: competence/damage-inducible protein A [Solirubrobacterales bacterium]
MSVRAGLVITGTELLSGQVRDRNGPWLAEQLAGMGVELAHVVTCGDRPDDLAAALRFMSEAGVALVVTSGGLGPTADDLTAEVVARFAGREMELDVDLERRIGEIVARFARRWRIDNEALAVANRKQAMVPRGAVALDPVGTAPGLVVPADEQTVVVLPGPPRELQESWAQAVETKPFRAVLAGAVAYETRMLRMFGLPESEIAASLREIGEQIDLESLEITTCLRRGELEVTIRTPPGAADAADRLVALLAGRHGDALYSTDGSRIEDQVARLMRGRRLAVGESCTGGMLAARLTDRPGASEFFAGGVVAYSDRAKSELLGVPAEVIDAHGAVSEQVADALADGAIERFDAQVGIGVTGVAGPGGGTEDKPVGRVCFCVVARNGTETERVTRALDIPGSRPEVRDRSTTVALHLLRRLLVGEEVPA